MNIFTFFSIYAVCSVRLIFVFLEISQDIQHYFPRLWGMDISDAVFNDIIPLLCSIRICVHVNNFSSKSTRPRDMLFLLKDTLFIKDESIVQGMQICLLVCSQEPLETRYPH